MCYFGQVGPALDELCKLKLVVFLVFEEFAYLKACEFAADVVLGFHSVQEAKGGDGLADDRPELEIVNEVHAEF